MYYVFFIHCQWTLGLFTPLTVVNNAVMNMGVHISLSDPAFNSFGYIPRSEIAGSYGNYSLRHLHIVLQSGYTILYSQQ